MRLTEYSFVLNFTQFFQTIRSTFFFGRYYIASCCFESLKNVCSKVLPDKILLIPTILLLICHNFFSGFLLQPMVRKIKENNRKTIYLSSHIGKIKGWLRPDTMCFVDDLIEYATQKKFKYVHKWKVNDLIMWDNRQTMHRVRSFDDVNESRDMRRTTIEGEEALI